VKRQKLKFDFRQYRRALNSPHPTDLRAQLAQSWAERYTGSLVHFANASSDASFRRYFRATQSDGSTRIIMDAPPEREDTRPFAKVNALMQAAGVHVPEIFAHDAEQGFMLLADVGTQTYLDVINEQNADELMRAAIHTLVKWQLASQEGVLPAYDASLLSRELSLFPEWYVNKHRQISFNDEENNVWHSLCQLLIKHNLSSANVYVHRDYMPRNLMVSDPMPCVLDHQDATYGPISYDIASLCADAFISWDEERVLDWTIRYWEAAKKSALPVPAVFGDFYDSVAFMALQRHLKILGIFARIFYRDGKPKYLADTPRFIRYVRKTAGRYQALSPLLHLLDRIEGDAQLTQGYSF
jgi:aminoglycoside/choline kinase family phosphotransferase